VIVTYSEDFDHSTTSAVVPRLGDVSTTEPSSFTTRTTLPAVRVIATSTSLPQDPGDFAATVKAVLPPASTAVSEAVATSAPTARPM
jgi:hypothetical protein